MTGPLRGLYSMATKDLLAELSEAWPGAARFESAGGVEIVRRLRAGARADVAVLDRDQMAALEADGLFEPGTLRPMFVSDVVAAVPEDAAAVNFSTEADLRTALAGSGRIACSTGPSGRALVDLLGHWGLLDAVQDRLVRARPGTPVGALLAAGDADLGFQQRSELSGVAGVRVLGPLPGTAAIRSTFSGAVLDRSGEKAAARELLEWCTSAAAQERVVAAGMAVA